MEKEIVFDKEVSSALEIAKKLAQDARQTEYGAAHLLKAMLHRDFTLLKELEGMGKDVYFIEEWAEVRMEETPKTVKPVIPQVNESVEAVIEEAEAVGELLDRNEVDLFCAMVALSTPGVGFNFDQIKTFPVSRAELLNERDEENVNHDLLNLPSERAITKLLHKYCINKTAKAKNKEVPAVVGREKELKEMVEILCRFSKPNVLLQGYPGVGKSALTEGFVQLVVNKRVPEKLLNTEVFELDLGAVIAGASYKGEIEDRLKKLLKEVRHYPKVILIIDGIHVLLDKNNNAGISSILKSEAAKGLTLIVTTTIDEYTKKIEPDEGLSGMFEVLKVEEPNPNKAFRIIKAAIKSYKKHHGVNVEDQTINESIRLAGRYLKEKSLPESALNLLDRTMSVIKTAGDAFLKEKDELLNRIETIKNQTPEKQEQELAWLQTDLEQKAYYLLTEEERKKLKPAGLKDALYIKQIETLINQLAEVAQVKKEMIDISDLRAVTAQKTGIPLGKLQDAEKVRLGNMQDILRKRVVGQDQAIQIVSDAILESRSGLSKDGQPIGSFFFLGPTGTGKTELAKTLADFLFQDEKAIIRFDMSEFKEEHSAALLYGAPPGYVGYEEGGLLVNKIRQKPYSIVLFDEIEKAHSSVFDVFLQIMDEGKLHDRLGKEGDFSNALVLFTSNIGSTQIIEKINQEKRHPTSTELMELMSRQFRPEFLGRLTEIIPFGPITREHAMGIFEIHLQKELFDLLKGLKIDLEITHEVKEFLVKNGFNATYGARPLKGIIRSELRRPLAKRIITDKIAENQKIKVVLENEQLEWKIL